MEINECPKCGFIADFTRGFEHDWDRNTSRPFYYVRCDNCGTVGYDDPDPEEAIRKWNDGEISLSERELYDVYMEVGFYKHFYVWADSKSDAEHRIKDAIEEGKVKFTDIAPGSLDFRNDGPTSPKYDPERYQREVLNPRDKYENVKDRCDDEKSLRICETCGKPITCGCMTNQDEDFYTHDGDCFVRYMNKTYGEHRWMEINVVEECGGYYLAANRSVVGGYIGTGIYYTEFEEED